jgi:hypothetical protein
MLQGESDDYDCHCVQHLVVDRGVVDVYAAGQISTFVSEAFEKIGQSVCSVRSERDAQSTEQSPDGNPPLRE